MQLQVNGRASSQFGRRHGGLVAGGVAAAAAGAACGQINTSFDSFPSNWRIVNNSQFASEPDGWQQAFSFPFGPHSSFAFAGSSASANTEAGIISTWLITPTVPLHNGDALDFWVRSLGERPDRMQVRMSTSGSGSSPGFTPTSVGVFTTLLLDINPTYAPTGFPGEWTRYTVYVSGLTAATSGRFAFRYFVEDGGPWGPNGSFVGVDDVQLTPMAPGTGACCKPDGSCAVVTPTGCTDMNGGYAGDGIPCAWAGCGTMPCCLPDGHCTAVSGFSCEAAGGYWCSGAEPCRDLGCFSVTGLNTLIFYGSPGLPGPDTTAPLTISGQHGRIIDGGLSVGFDVSAHWQGAFRARVVHPDGTTVQLIQLPGVPPPKVFGGGNGGFSNEYFGGGGTMMQFIDDAPLGVYDSAAGYPGPPPGTQTGTDHVAGTWRPYFGTLSQFDGKPLEGTWRLIVNDDGSGNNGFIHGFKVCVPRDFCYANMDHSTTMPCLNVLDFVIFLNLYAVGDSRANCDMSTAPPVLNVLDFSCFLNAYASCTAC